MFVRGLSFSVLLFLVHCGPQGQVNFERCGCEASSRRQILVEAYMDNEELVGDFLRRIVELQKGIGGRGNYDPVRVEGVCAELESRKVVFCASDERDYEALRQQFSDVNFRPKQIN